MFFSTERKSSSQYLQSFCSLLQNSVLPWLRDVTGVDLNNDIDMFSAQYKSTGALFYYIMYFLLCLQKVLKSCQKFGITNSNVAVKKLCTLLTQ